MSQKELENFKNFEQFAKKASKLESQFTYDFMGTKSDMKFNAAKGGTGGKQLPPPNGMVEFNSLLWAVETSGEKFTVAEMGAGFGIWALRGASAARNIDKKFEIIAVEGEITHYEWLIEHCTNNDIKPKDHELLHGVVGASDGFCLFPLASKPDTQWGLRALNVSEAEIENIEASNRLMLNANGTYSLKKHPQLEYASAKSYSVEKLIKKHKIVDFMHFDIQGSELDAITANIESINKKVRMMYIATHSTAIEDGMRVLLADHGWTKWYDEPQKMRPNGYMGDGEQIWHNPRLA